MLYLFLEKTMPRNLKDIEREILEIKRAFAEIGAMRPGNLN